MFVCLVLHQLWGLKSDPLFCIYAQPSFFIIVKIQGPGKSLVAAEWEEGWGSDCGSLLVSAGRSLWYHRERSASKSSLVKGTKPVRASSGETRLLSAKSWAEIQGVLWWQGRPAWEASRTCLHAGEVIWLSTCENGRCG